MRKSDADASRLARSSGIDALRYVLAFTVVLFHALPWDTYPRFPLWAALLGYACHGTLPFFFIVSGYFLRPSVKFVDIIFKPIYRLMPIYLFWMVVYFALLQAFPVHSWSFKPSGLLWGGSAFHLWFLTALSLGLAFVGAGLYLVGTRVTGIVCAILAVTGILLGTYHDALHLPGSSLHTEPMVAPMFIYIGAALRNTAINWPLRNTVALGFISIAFVLIEEYMIYVWSGEPCLLPHSFIFSSFPLGIAIFGLAKNLPGVQVIRKVGQLGSITLSVYAVHLFFVWLLIPIIGNDTPLDLLMLTSVAFVVSTGIALGLQRIPILGRFVR